MPRQQRGRPPARRTPGTDDSIHITGNAVHVRRRRTVPRQERRAQFFTKAPDSINAIDWSLKNKNREQFDYYHELIRLRREHPHSASGQPMKSPVTLVFDKIESPNIISYSLKDNAGGDS